MAIDKKDLTEEQKKALEKLFKKYVGGLTLAFFLYFGFLILANVSIAILDAAYLHNGFVRTLMFIGTFVITMGGLRGTFEEKSVIFSQEAKKIAGKR